MLNALRENWWFNGNLVGEDVRFPLFFSVVEATNPVRKLSSCFAVAALKRIRLVIFAFLVLFVAVLNKENFAELAEGRDGAAASSLPKGLMTFTNGGPQLLPRYCYEILPRPVFVEAPLGRFAKAFGDIGEVIPVTFPSREFVKA